MAVIRLDRFIAEGSSLSRSQARDAIRQGRAAVSGVCERRPERRLDPDKETVTLDGVLLTAAAPVYLMMNKPEGYVCATEDRSEKTVLELLPEPLRKRDLFPVGRLDKDTTGLLLLTNDGDYAHRVISPRHHIPKRYLARTYGTPYEADAAAFQ